MNGRLRGTGPAPRNGDEDEGQGRDKDGREFYSLDSPSHPEQGQFEFHDPIANFNLVSANGVRGIAYSVGPLGQPCVSFSGDGVVNGRAGYLYTFLPAIYPPSAPAWDVQHHRHRPTRHAALYPGGRALDGLRQHPQVRVVQRRWENARAQDPRISVLDTTPPSGKR